MSLLGGNKDSWQTMTPQWPGQGSRSTASRHCHDLHWHRGHAPTPAWTSCGTGEDSSSD